MGSAKACSCVGICLVTQHPGTDNDRLEFDFEHFQPQGEGTESDRGLASNSQGQMLFENLRAVVVDHHQWSMTCFLQKSVFLRAHSPSVQVWIMTYSS